jgi:selenocysteine lyase/cysteine desulfurase
MTLGSPIGGERAAFAVPDGVAYFNTASLAPLLRRAVDAGHEALRRRSQPWAVKTRDWFDDVERLRTLAGTAVGLDVEGMALVPASSYGMAVAARNLAPRAEAGGAILVLADEYPSGIYTWRRLAADTGAEIVTVRREPGESWTDAVLAALDAVDAVDDHGGPIGIVSVPNVHWTDGARLDLSAVARRTHEVGAALVIDASQSLGVMRLDVDELRPDFVVSVGYKWLLGTVGRSYLWVAEKHRDGRPIEENWVTRAGADDFAALVDYRDEYQPGARRFDQGARTLFETTPVAIAGLEQLGAWGVAEIEAALGRVTAVIAGRLAAMGLEPSVPEGERSPHILGIAVPDSARDRIVPALERAGCYAALRGSTLRIAPHLHITDPDIDALTTALASSL